MSMLAKLEQSLLSKQLLEAEIDNQLSEFPDHPMQLSLYLLSAKDLQPSIHSKVHRLLKFTIDGQVFESKVSTCEGISQTATWNEAFLLPVKSMEASLKLVYVEQETSSKPLGGVVLKLSGLSDQKRHDGWYDLGYGKVRLAIRFIHDASLLLEEYLRVLAGSIQQTEDFIRKSHLLNQDTTLMTLYLKYRSCILTRLVKNAKVVRKKCLQRFQGKETEDFGIRSENSELEANTEDLESFIKKLDQEMKENLSFPVLSSKDPDFSLNQSKTDLPPYIEAAEKTCKRRIPIKRY